jgi:Concanavalin A-like lectin/glucanases superfamily
MKWNGSILGKTVSVQSSGQSTTSGGTMITLSDNSVLHRFTDSGEFIVNYDVSAEILLVGGGGGGASDGGGGGAGGVLYGTVILPSGKYYITVGSGGGGGLGSSSRGGSNGTLTSITGGDSIKPIVFSTSFAANGYLLSPVSPAFILDSDFQVECWVFYTSYTNYATFFSSVKLDGITVGIMMDSVNARITNSGTANNSIPWHIPLNTWTHVAFGYSSEDNTCYAFVNGTLQGTVTKTLKVTGQQIVVGARYTNGSYGMRGYVSNLRVVKGAVLYTEDFAVPSAPLNSIERTLLLMCKTDLVNADNSTNNYHINQAGVINSVNESPFTINASTGAVASGGGGGGSFWGGFPPQSGGSGGGDSYGPDQTLTTTGGSANQPSFGGLTGYAHKGGGGINQGRTLPNGANGGGGGAGEPGGDATDYLTSGAGGVGLGVSITGSLEYYAGGGGGGSANYTNAGAGGRGGGGGGSSGRGTNGAGGGYGATDGSSFDAAGSGGANTGGGGGGGFYKGSFGSGGNGGSGLALIRIRAAQTQSSASGIFNLIFQEQYNLSNRWPRS